MNGEASRCDPDLVNARLCEALATAVDVDPLSMDPPLYDVVDPDALARLVECGGLTEVRFEYDGHVVGIDDDGSVSVDGTVYDR